MKFILHLKKIFVELFWGVINKFSPKDRKSLLFIPHPNCNHDGYDIFNAESDNVLVLFNSILVDERFRDYKLSLVVYDTQKIGEYVSYTRAQGRIVRFVSASSPYSFFSAFIKSRFVFVDDSMHKFLYKSNNQKIICLNYFAGLMKNEFFKWEKRGGYKRMLIEQYMMYKSFDIHLSESEISSKFIALDNCMYYPRFLNLGFPRNDIFYRDNKELRENIKKLFDFDVRFIVTYVPTHRDYENPKRMFYNENCNFRTIFGPITEVELSRFEHFLEETGTLLIAKVHPKQVSDKILLTQSNHIIYYHNLVEHIQTSLNPVMSISDFLITDYTTAVYDFLHTNKPIIYYFYDYEEYVKTRGFFINPIECICAGPIVYDMSHLIDELSNLTISNIDDFALKRKFLRNMFIKNDDGNSCGRIKNLILKYGD